MPRQIGSYWNNGMEITVHQHGRSAKRLKGNFQRKKAGVNKKRRGWEKRNGSGARGRMSSSLPMKRERRKRIESSIKLVTG